MSIHNDSTHYSSSGWSCPFSWGDLERDPERLSRLRGDAEGDRDRDLDRDRDRDREVSFLLSIGLRDLDRDLLRDLLRERAVSISLGLSIGSSDIFLEPDRERLSLPPDLDLFLSL